VMRDEHDDLCAGVCRRRRRRVDVCDAVILAPHA
jgi:hypothetical protein